jgi:hypothetical protein
MFVSATQAFEVSPPAPPPLPPMPVTMTPVPPLPIGVGTPSMPPVALVSTWRFRPAPSPLQAKTGSVASPK